MTTLAPVTTQATVTVDGVQLLMRVFGGPQPVDSEGIEWICTKLEGWHGSPKNKTQRTDRPYSAGAYRSRAYKDIRTIGVEAKVNAPDEDTIRRVELGLGAWCADGGRLYEFTVTEPPLEPMTAFVELDDAVLISPATRRSIVLSAQFAAPDPRKWASRWMDRTTGMPQPSADGADWTDGLDFTAPGLDYGVGAVPAIAQVANYGTAPVGPYLAITGPLPAGGQVIDQVSGWSLTYTDALGTGDVLTINCDEVAQRGQPGHSAILNGVTSVWSKVIRSGDWPTIDPQDVATYQINALALTTVTLVASVRSAWW